MDDWRLLLKLFELELFARNNTIQLELPCKKNIRFTGLPIVNQDPVFHYELVFVQLAVYIPVFIPV